HARCLAMHHGKVKKIALSRRYPKSSDQSHDPLRCDEHFPSSPDFPTSDSYMEYDDLPDLQEVQEEASAVPVYQVEVGVSHQERHAHTQAHNSQPPDTHWLTQLAHIATGPQSPLLQDNIHVEVQFIVCVKITHKHFPHSDSSQSWLLMLLFLFPQKSSECGSAVSTRSSLSDDEDMGWSFSCPPTAWHCFLKGTHLRFHSGSNVEWQDAEDLEEDAADEEQSRFLKVH
uniref:AXH domain-containing protein n=1 Tax=Acanthochromis polyacanthus TaxID=80966 RepID=A0A3Q1ETR6_9TELE